MAQYQETIVGKPGGLVEPGVRQYGFFKKAFKKIKKGAKKVWKSPLGKIGIGALLAGAPIGGGGWFGSGSGWGKGIGFLRNRGMLGAASKLARPAGMPGNLSWSAAQAAKPSLFSRLKGGLGKFGYGKAALLGLGAAGVAAPFLGGDEDEEIIDDWSVTPSSIAKIRQMAKDRHSSLAFLPPAESVMSGYYGSKEVESLA